jgi:hypothetical protein
MLLARTFNALTTLLVLTLTTAPMFQPEKESALLAQQILNVDQVLVT